MTRATGRDLHSNPYDVMDSLTCWELQQDSDHARELTGSMFENLLRWYVVEEAQKKQTQASQLEQRRRE